MARVVIDNRLENSDLENATESSQVSQNSIDSNIGSTYNCPACDHNCPACDQVAEDDTIVCEECDEWFHFHCVGVDPSNADNIPEETPFVCILCNDSLIKTGGAEWRSG